MRLPGVGGRGGSRGGRGERGQALALFAIFLLVLMTALALVINGGILRRSNQELWNALDAAALAAAQSLPANPTLASSDALRYATINHPGLAASSVAVNFRCLVGDRNKDGRPDTGDVPAMCNPGASAAWTCSGGTCVANCNPGAGGVCNTVVVTGTVKTDYQFSALTNVDGATTTFQSAACSGLCGASPSSLVDVGLIIDRTSSMSDADLANVKNAALATLRVFKPPQQQVALAVLGQSRTSPPCTGSGSGGARGIAALIDETGTWVVAPYPLTRPMSSDYKLSNGATNPSSQLVSTISCLNHSQTRTNLGDPLLALAQQIVNRGRTGVPKGIILMTDGAANMPNSTSCRYAADKASAVRAMGVEIYTIGFGVVGDLCVDASGTYRGAQAASLLADMATGPTRYDGCTDAENKDGDHFFCEARTDSLSSVFTAAATALIKGNVRLVHLPGS